MQTKFETESDLRNLHVYPLKRDYYGYENVGDNKLTKYTIGQVEQKIRDAFQPGVFVDPAIIAGVTSVIVVPDHYGFLPDKIADEINKKNRKYYIVPFTHVLHPGVVGPAFRDLIPPSNAAVLYEIEQLALKKTIPIPPKMVQVSFSSPKEIRQLLRSDILYAAKSPDMDVQEQNTQQPPLRRRNSLRYQNSLARSSSLHRRSESSDNNSWEARADDMSVIDQELARKKADREEYDKAWEKMRARAHSLTRTY